jgi:hypothetical protein
MEFLSKIKTIEWLSQNNLHIENGIINTTGFQTPLCFSLPIDSHAKTTLNKEIVSFFDMNDESLLWIDEYGIWQSAEDWHLFKGFRSSLGEDADVWEKPGHLFNHDDIISARSLISLVLYFYCGAYVISPARNIIVRISHDEFIKIYTKDQQLLSDTISK